MNKPRLYALLLSIGVIVLIDSCSQKTSEEKQEAPESLPMKEISLTDLSAFKEGSKGWSLSTELLATPDGFSSKPGTGILTSSGAGELTTKLQHSDLDLKFSFVLTNGADFKITLLEQYPLIISQFEAGKMTSLSGGGIPVSADSASETATNPLKTSGLWQTLQLSFKAPRFDAQGNKVENAIFSEVYLNGFLVQSDVEVKESIATPGKKETGAASLLLTANNAPVAIKDIQYKSFGLEKLTLSDLEYSLYKGTWDKLPDFSTMTPEKTGKVEEFSIKGLADGNDHYGIVFKGNLSVPTSGDYLFESRIDDGGDLIIDGELVIHNDGEPGFGAAKGLITLEKGVHTFESSYYQDVWGSMLLIDYEGPEISPKTFGVNPYGNSGRRREPLVVMAESEPRLIRSFLEYKDTRKTHPLSIITEEKVNYSYDLLNGSLIKGWKGADADASEMWRARGEPQLLKPLNFSVDFSDNVPVAKLLSASDAWPKEMQEDFKVLGYDINTAGLPVINYQLGNLQFHDITQPSQDLAGLTREVGFINPESNGLTWFQIAAGNSIYQLSNGWYCVDGNYYIVIDQAADINVVNRFDKELIVQLPNAPEMSTFKYSIIW